MSRRKRPIDRIAPNFADRWGADSPEEALAKAERAPTSSDPATFARCPGIVDGEPCLSTKIHSKPGLDKAYDHKIDDKKKKCSACSHHFNTPVAPRAEFKPDEPRCPSCDAARLVEADRAAHNWRCLGCGERFDEAAEAPTDEPTPADDPDPDPGPIMPRDLKTTTEEYRIPTGDDLREMREALDLSLREVPVAAGTTIGGWERGETRPRLDRLEDLVEYYRTVDAARRAERLDAALGALDDEPEAEAVEDAEPASPEADPFDWVGPDDLRAATDGGEAEVEVDTSRC